MNKTKYIPVPKHGLIDKPGYYFLERDFISKDIYAIKIECNNVTLDLNKYSVLTQYKNKSITTYGIFAPEQTNTFILNGRIMGSSFGVHAPYSKNFSALLIAVHECSLVGMNIGGSFPSIKNCDIRYIGGHESEGYAIGINSTDASNAVISSNIIRDIYRQNVSKDIIGEGVAILLGHDSKSCMISSNTVLNEQFDLNSYSLWAVGKSHLITNNVFCNSQYGVYMGNSILQSNIIMLKERQDNSFAVSGGEGTCYGNALINYEKDYNYELQEETTKPIPFRIE